MKAPISDYFNAAKEGFELPILPITSKTPL